ncbi:hypothetical protein [Methylogaea oryzae]|nr:hypothetical protein [Methylogaea oryzae]
MAVTLKYCLSHKSAATQGAAVRHPCRDCSPEQKLATINRFTLDELFHGKGFDEYKTAVGGQFPSKNSPAKYHA